ncbi:MAG: haloacid dehalogenase type II [Dehalococcoidia bacterium]
MQQHLESVHTLTFDVFGTILDLGGSLADHIQTFLAEVGSPLSAQELWGSWRLRQRLEQYQDSLLLMGHSGYQETARRALLYVLRQASIPFTSGQVERLMAAWQHLKPFPDVGEGLRRLKSRYRLAIVSNGERAFLEYLVAHRIAFPFDAIISVQEVGVFKPHPAVYRSAARLLGEEPHHLLMVSANSFDVMGARSCGYHGAWVNREGLPYEETPYLPDLTVRDFRDLAQALGC